MRSMQRRAIASLHTFRSESWLTLLRHRLVHEAIRSPGVLGRRRPSGNVLVVACPDLQGVGHGAAREPPDQLSCLAAVRNGSHQCAAAPNVSSSVCAVFVCFASLLILAPTRRSPSISTKRLSLVMLAITAYGDASR